MCRHGKATLRRMACVLALLAAGVGSALAQPATLRLGYGTAAEEPLWLIVAKPELAKNQGKAYILDATRFTGSDKRGQAFEAGAIDLASSSANGVIFAAAEGVSAKIVASISRESPRGSAPASTSRTARRSGRSPISRARSSASTVSTHRVICG